MITAEAFKREVYSWAEQVGVEPVEVHLRHMTRKLASCSSRGRVTFDPCLLQEGQKERGRAILHELLHLKYPNHGRMHTQLVEAYLAQGLSEQDAELADTGPMDGPNDEGSSLGNQSTMPRLNSRRRRTRASG